MSAAPATAPAGGFPPPGCFTVRRDGETVVLTHADRRGQVQHFRFSTLAAGDLGYWLAAVADGVTVTWDAPLPETLP